VTPPIFYLGSPYSHDDLGVREERHRYVCQAAARLFERGIYTYSPIAHTVAINELGGLNEAAFEFWRAFDLGMVDRLTGLMVLMLPGWRESVGLTAELTHARATGKPVLWCEPAIDARTGRLTGYQLHEDEPVAEDEDADEDMAALPCLASLGVHDCIRPQGHEGPHACDDLCNRGHLRLRDVAALASTEAEA